MTHPHDIEIGVIGGSGLYSFLDDITEIRIDTPYGEPSDALLVGEYSGRKIAFLPRHGRAHSVPPHDINYRANLWALRSTGVRQVLAPCAVGGLQARLGPGTLVIPDQFVDRTYGREQTFYDGKVRPDGQTPAVVHMSMADPYCPAGRAAAAAAARAEGWEPVEDGTLVVIQGPRFSTRAESRWYSAQDWSVIGMTGYPEAPLARELGMCYTSLALVTDLDAGVEVGEGVTHEDVLRVFAENIDRLRPVLFGAVKALPTERACLCSRALDGMDTGFELP
ncbi:S-methyl-5'-thioadenosine phosphorylase [Streptomyces sp. NPDC059224]|uniref:S-methyl-5'-thioadenosine phosphorylase n=1 Tax=Streptomyces sp. NPDC059224 TaxID=3346775 RepID=UPI003685490F